MFVQCPSEFRFFTSLCPKASQPSLRPKIPEVLNIYRLLMWLLSNDFSWPEVLLTLIVVFLNSLNDAGCNYLIGKINEKLSVNMVFRNCPKPAALVRKKNPNRTLDKIGIPMFRFPIGTYSNNVYCMSVHETCDFIRFFKHMPFGSEIEKSWRHYHLNISIFPDRCFVV